MNQSQLKRYQTDFLLPNLIFAVNFILRQELTLQNIFIYLEFNMHKNLFAKKMTSHYLKLLLFAVMTVLIIFLIHLKKLQVSLLGSGKRNLHNRNHNKFLSTIFCIIQTVNKKSL